MAWALNKVQDTNGNYFTVSYTEDNPNGQSYPSRIDYGGNSAVGTAPYNAIQFIYEARLDDWTSTYQAGSLIRSRVRLKNVQAFTAATLVKDFRLEYEVGAATARSKLTSVTECAANSECLPPTVFTWQQGVSDFDPAGTWASGLSTNMAATQVGDFDGDGKTDIVQFGSDLVFRVWLSNGAGFNGPNLWGQQYSADTSTTRLGDFNGDGKTDVITFTPNGCALVWLSTEPQFNANFDWGCGYAFDISATQLGDFNGDGKTDIIQFGADGVSRVRLSTGGGVSGLNLWGQYHGTNMAALRLGEFDGDGKTDVIKFEPNGCATVWRSRANQFNASVDWGCGYSGDMSATQLGDFNGDGKSDIMQFADGVSRVWFSTGTGVSAPNLWGQDHGTNMAALRLGDFNKDEKTDVIKFEADGSATVWISARDSFNPYDTWGTGFGTDPSAMEVGDFSGVGSSAIMRVGADGVATGWMSNSTRAEMLLSIRDGFNVLTNITYKPLTDSSVHTKDADPVAPLIHAQTPLYVVSGVGSSNGVGGIRSTNYTYGGAKADMSGRGFLGFRWMRALDQSTGISSYQEFSQTYPYIGMPIKSQRALNGVALNYSESTLAATPLGGTRYFPYVALNAEVSYENGQWAGSTSTESTYDSFGNPTQITVNSYDGYIKTTTSTYYNDTSNWILGRLLTTQVNSTMPNGSFGVRNSSFSYHPTNGLLHQEIIEPGTPYALTTGYTYDAFGNKTSATVSGPDIVSRTTTTTYDAQGRFPIKTTNALGHSETRTFDPRFGTLTSLKGPNGLTTTWIYDGFGHKTSETRADNTTTAWNLAWCAGNCPQSAQYYSTVSSSGAPTSQTYFDSLNREVRSQTQGFDTGIIAKDTQYNALGQVSAVSRPYKVYATPQWSTSAYDSIGRLIRVTGPDGSVTTSSQHRFNFSVTETVTDALGQTTTRVTNSQGQLAQVTDALGSVTRYTYDAFGNLTQTLDPAGNAIRMQYDGRGRKISMTDPDMGYWRYAYNALGELISQTDAKNQVVNIQYDKLGRMTQRSEPDLIGTWEYDSAANGIGKLAKVTGANGYVQTLSYDALGRPIRASTTIDTTYQVNTSYDALGRVDTITYPTGFATKNIYTGLGYLTEVRNAATNALFWRANEQDADGHVTYATLGNGLTTVRSYNAQTGVVAGIYTGNSSGWNVQNNTHAFDAIGNLINRQDANSGGADLFSYDGLNRLTWSYSGQQVRTYQYDTIGNLVSKSDVGTYTYPTNGIRPHAVTSVAGTVNASYGYDANGNMTAGDGRSVTYTSFNMPSSIARSGQSATFVYDPDHARVKQETQTATTIYLSARYDAGLHFEKETKAGLTEYKHYLYAGKALIGVHTTKSDGPSSTRYFHHDHIGSIAVVTDEAGAIVARYAFDPHGKRILISGDPDATHHGFTGHEELADLGLVHMNGRVYDPTLGRFMSADPTIQFFDNLQGLNRYSYVLNNPLSFMDPSGYKIKWKKIFRAVVAIVAAYFTAGAASMAYASSAATAGAITTSAQFAAIVSTANVVGGVAGGFVGGAIQSGTVKGALGGAFSGGLFAGVGNLELPGLSKVGAHALAGGASSAIQGGDFKSGFLSAGFAELAGPYTQGFGSVGNGVARMVVGGTASVLGGGKFENGAATAAFGYLFNYCAHNGCFNRRFTWADAVDQWRNGNGGTVTGVDASELNLRGATYTKNEDGSYQIHTNIKLETGVVYGTVTGDLNVNGTLSIRPDYYNFDFKNPANASSWSEAWRLVKRDFFTGAGAVVNGYGGNPYSIEFTGAIPAPPGLPR